MPDCFGFVVGLMDCDPKTFWVKAENLCHQFPRPWDCVFFEVVTKTEVAKHLEKDKVTLCTTNIIKVIVLATSADTLLNRDGAVVRRYFITHEVRLEGHHSGHRKEQRLVVRDKAGRRHNRMRTVTKELRKSRPQLVCAAGRTG